jgi:hypothetical protein
MIRGVAFLDAQFAGRYIARLGEAVHMRLVEERLERLEASQPQQIASYRKVA